jgi:NAD(P)-dependent dehydrogenase (short-subunit alcohol dehydrogenase family)
MRDFHDKVAFVTGGASGLGFALARAFGRARMKVMLADIDVDSLETAVAELKRIRSVSAVSSVTYLIVQLYSAPQRKPWLHSARCTSSATTRALAPVAPSNSQRRAIVIG